MAWSSLAYGSRVVLRRTGTQINQSKQFSSSETIDKIKKGIEKHIDLKKLQTQSEPYVKKAKFLLKRYPEVPVLIPVTGVVGYMGYKNYMKNPQYIDEYVRALLGSMSAPETPQPHLISQLAKDVPAADSNQNQASKPREDDTLTTSPPGIVDKMKSIWEQVTEQQEEDDEDDEEEEMDSHVAILMENESDPYLSENVSNEVLPDSEAEEPDSDRPIWQPHRGKRGRQIEEDDD